MSYFDLNDPFLDNGNVIQRLLKEYYEHGSLIIGVDFDNTIYDCHKKGFKFPALISLLQSCSNAGFTLCPFTANNNHSLVTEVFNSIDVDIYTINKSPVEFDSRKPFFNILLDDRAGLSSAYTALNAVLSQIYYDSIKEVTDEM